MTYTDFYTAINTGVQQHGDEYNFIGVRYANQLHAIGDALAPSKHNPDREDDREFPEYGSDEYDALPDLPGASCWLVYNSDFDRADDVDASNVYALQKPYWQSDDTIRNDAGHCYLIAGNRVDTHSDADYGEEVIVDAVVIRALY